MSPLDKPIHVTFFEDKFSSTLSTRQMSMRDIAKMALETKASTKDALPWIKLAKFGNQTFGESRALRTNGNMLEVHGIEIDYDDKKITTGEAARRLKAAGVAALIYTSPSHAIDSPKWRVLAPLSGRVPPDAREKLCGVLNTVLGGIAADESFTPSQSYYIGETPTSIDHHAELIDGRFLDDIDGVTPTPKKKKTSETAVALPPRSTDQSTIDYASACLLAGCACFEDPGFPGGRHGAIVSVTKMVAPFVLGGFIDDVTVVETIRERLGRDANSGEIESALRGAKPLVLAYVPATGDEFGAVPAPDLPAEDITAWRSMLQRGEPKKKGELGAIKGNLLNACLALNKAPEWRGVLRFSEFANKVMFFKPPPWHSAAVFAPHEARDIDGTRAAVWLQNEGIQVTPQTAGWAMADAADQDRYHPVRDHLDSLKWDGVPRADAWLVDHLGAEDTPLNRAFSAKFLLSMVARVRRPGCKVDTVLTLEGRQGLKKSSALHALSCGWFTDHMPELTSKDAAIQTHGVWLVEFAELANLHRGEMAKTKAFISTAVDRLRMPFGRNAEDHPRQCVFAATVNPGAVGYLQDETGNRRFWPVACGVGWPESRKADILAITAARDQIWAEADHRYRAGEPWWLDDEMLEQHQNTAAENRRAVDVWTTAVADYAKDKADVTIPEIMRGALGMATERWNNADGQRVGRILTSLGMLKRQRRIGPRDRNAREWFYCFPETKETGNVVEFRPETGPLAGLVSIPAP